MSISAPGSTVKASQWSLTEPIKSSSRGSLRVGVGIEGLALGGCPINAVDLARTLRDRGHTVEMCAIGEPAPVTFLPYAHQCGFDVTILPRRGGIAARSLDLHGFAKRHRLDILHVYAPWLGPAAAMAACLRGNRTAVITNWTMTNDVRTPSHVPLIVGFHSLLKESALGRMGPVWLMEPPVDVGVDRPDPVAGQAFRESVGVSPEDLLAVIVSRLDQEMKAEGVENSILAMSNVPDSRLRLVIIGDGDAYHSLACRAREVNTRLGRPAVQLLGAKLDPHPAYAAADIVLGMGGSALRAMAHAKPLIVLGENGFSKLSEPGNTAYFDESGFYGRGHDGDPVGGLARLLRRLLDGGVRHTLGQYGYSEVQRRFSLAAQTDTLERVYAHALASPAPRWSRATEASGYVARDQVRRLLGRASELVPPVTGGRRPRR